MKRPSHPENGKEPEMLKHDTFAAFIHERFYNEIASAIDTHLHEKNLRAPIGSIPRDEIEDFNISDWKCKRVYSHNMPGNEIGIDVRAEADFEVEKKRFNYHDDVEEDDSGQWFLVSCHGDMKKQLSDFTVDSVKVYDGLDHYDEPLDMDLVPYIASKDYDKVAERILTEYYPEALDNAHPAVVNPRTLASRMGLTLLEEHISEDGSIFGRCFFKECDTEYFDRDRNEMVPIHVSSGTIMIDPDIFFMRNIGSLNLTIAHECVHWYLHRKAALLMDIYSDESSTSLNCKVTYGLANTGDSNALRIMETQANAIAPRLLMPRNRTLDRIFHYFIEVEKMNARYTMPEKCVEVISKLGEIHGLSRQAAKIRLVELGYEEARGTYIWLDNHYVRPYMFKKGAISPSQTYSIDFSDAAFLLRTDETLKKVVTEGAYVFVENHFCLNRPEYLQEDSNGNIVLTDYARTHMDECCLAFDMNMRSQTGRGSGYTTLCYLNREPEGEEYLRSKVDFSFNYNGGQVSPEARKKADDAFVRQMFEDRNSLTGNWRESLKKFYERKELTQANLAKEIGISDKTIRSIINENGQTSFESLLKLCLGLHIPPLCSEQILNASPYNFDFSNPNHQYYWLVLNTMWEQKMEKINDFLREHGIVEL